MTLSNTLYLNLNLYDSVKYTLLNLNVKSGRKLIQKKIN